MQAVAAELGYKPDRAGVRLRTGRTFVIGLILDQTVAIAEFERRIILGVSQVLYGTPYHLVVLPQIRDADPMEPIRYFVETAAADGIIFTHTRPGDEPRAAISSTASFPSSRTAAPRSAKSIRSTISTTSGSRRRRSGAFTNAARRRLALLPAPRYLTCSRHMLDGFRRGLSENGADAAR